MSIQLPLNIRSSPKVLPLGALTCWCRWAGWRIGTRSAWSTPRGNLPILSAAALLLPWAAAAAAAVAAALLLAYAAAAAAAVAVLAQSDLRHPLWSVPQGVVRALEHPHSPVLQAVVALPPVLYLVAAASVALPPVLCLVAAAFVCAAVQHPRCPLHERLEHPRCPFRERLEWAQVQLQLPLTEV